MESNQPALNYGRHAAYMHDYTIPPLMTVSGIGDKTTRCFQDNGYDTHHLFQTWIDNPHDREGFRDGIKKLVPGCTLQHTSIYNYIAAQVSDRRAIYETQLAFSKLTM